jgi:hypothetical protein
MLGTDVPRNAASTGATTSKRRSSASWASNARGSSSARWPAAFIEWASSADSACISS